MGFGFLLISMGMVVGAPQRLADPVPPSPVPQRMPTVPGRAAPMPGPQPDVIRPRMPSRISPAPRYDPRDTITPGGSYFPPQGRAPSVEDLSWLYIKAPEKRIFKVHDIITIIVSEKLQDTRQSRFNRQKNATLKAEINEFIRLGKKNNLRPAAKDKPKIDTNLTGRIQSTGNKTEQEGVTYRIAATIVDILPNGNLVLEARKRIRSDRDITEYTLSGVLRHTDVETNNTAQSEDIANLRIDLRRNGKIYDSTSRSWGTRLFDRFFPF